MTGRWRGLLNAGWPDLPLFWFVFQEHFPTNSDWTQICVQNRVETRNEMDCKPAGLAISRLTLVMKINRYFVHDAKVLEDGILRVGWCGMSGDCLSTGDYDISPDSPDYKFWLWLTQRLKRRWYQIGALSGLDEQAVAKYRQEYEHACANPETG
jgi:hypothetical protein